MDGVPQVIFFAEEGEVAPFQGYYLIIDQIPKVVFEFPGNQKGKFKSLVLSLADFCPKKGSHLPKTGVEVFQPVQIDQNRKLIFYHP